MRLITLSAIAVLLLTGCAGTIVGVGENTAGDPVTGQLDGKFVDGKVVLTLTALTARNGTCTGTATKADNRQLITSIPLQCADGRTGTATVTSDFINYRDTVVYQVGRERGRLTFGLSTQVTS